MLQVAAGQRHWGLKALEVDSKQEFQQELGSFTAAVVNHL
jgi:hypothetical protein